MTQNNNNIKSKTEQEYLNICDDFKNQIEAKNQELKKYKTLYMDTKKTASRCYGLICELQEYLENLSDLGGDPVYEHFSNSIRGNISNILFLKEETELDLIEEDDMPPINHQVVILS